MNLTAQQRRFAEHGAEAFVEACPGAGKTRTILARLAHIGNALPPRRGVAVLSFTNKAIEEFKARSAEIEVAHLLRHPGFVGTFDGFVRQFLFAPTGVEGTAAKPHVVESWNSLGVEIRLARGQAFRGPGVSLDLFDPLTNAIDPRRVGNAGLQKHVRENRASYERAAQTYRGNLKRKGYFSAGDARTIALQRVRQREWGQALGRALAGRFLEIVVDEAQDCNPHDLEVLQWLRNSGIRVTMVCDMDQSIYAFRDGERTHLEAFAETYEAANRLVLTGNFRSSPAICSLAASLRAATAADDSCGPTQNVGHPVAVYPYTGRAVSSAIGLWFAEYAEEESIRIPRAGLMILAHSTRAAQAAAGSGATATPGTSKVERLARAVGEFWAGTTRHGKSAALAAIETLLLEIQGLRNDGEPLSRAIERSHLDIRVLRRQALELAMRLPKRCPDTDMHRASWVECARNLLQELGIPIAQGQTIPGFFRMPPGADWSRCLEETATTCGIPYSTIHNAKGGEYPGVCVVIPPDDSRNLTTQFVTAWEGRTESESKRVIYVGVTRAMTLVALAIPAAFLPRCTAILQNAGVPHTIYRPAGN